MDNPITVTGLTMESCSRFKYPVLHIENSNGDKSYLMLFRFAFFQMCGTLNGEWSKGESTMHHLKYINVDKDFLGTAICESLNSYMNNTYGGRNNPVIRYTYKGKCCKTKYNEEYDHKPVVKYFAIENLPFITEFIDSNIKLINEYYNIA
jgi:hypothetical protein